MDIKYWQQVILAHRETELFLLHQVLVDLRYELTLILYHICQKNTLLCKKIKEQVSKTAIQEEIDKISNFKNKKEHIVAVSAFMKKRYTVLMHRRR